MTGRDRQSAARRPAAVAVEDDRDRAGDLGQIGLGNRADARERAEAREEAQRGSTAADSDLHDLGLFALQQIVDLRGVLVGELLHAALGRALLVVSDVTVLDQVFEVPHHVAAHVADRDAPLLGHRAGRP